MQRATFAVVVMVVGCILSTGCAKMYYKTWEKLGYEKRDILVDRVEDARDEQEAAKQEFKTTLERFQEVTGYSGGDLEAKYKKLSSSYEDCADRAEAVKERIASVEKVANDMFAEWKEEINQYSSADLKRASQQQLDMTKERYGELITVMKNAEVKMQPVLTAFNDQVLFLKHNLNAQAIASLQTTAKGIEQDVAKLIADMEASIAEANDFINQMSKSEKTS
jgi:hypothetical protein